LFYFILYFYTFIIYGNGNVTSQAELICRDINFIDWNTEFFRKMKQSTNTGVLMFSTGQYTYLGGKVSGRF
jgi:hypothetical protein